MPKETAASASPYSQADWSKSNTEIADEFGVHRSTISRARRKLAPKRKVKSGRPSKKASAKIKNARKKPEAGLKSKDLQAPSIPESSSHDEEPTWNQAHRYTKNRNESHVSDRPEHPAPADLERGGNVHQDPASNSMESDLNRPPQSDSPKAIYKVDIVERRSGNPLSNTLRTRLVPIGTELHLTDGKSVKVDKDLGPGGLKLDANHERFVCGNYTFTRADVAYIEGTQKEFQQWTKAHQGASNPTYLRPKRKTLNQTSSRSPRYVDKYVTQGSFWSVVDYRFTNTELMEATRATLSQVVAHRKKYAPHTVLVEVDWAKLDYRLSDKTLAQDINRNPIEVYLARAKHASHTIDFS